MRIVRCMIIPVAVTVLALGMLHADEVQGKTSAPEETPELTLEERLDQSFRAIRAQLKNAGFRLRYTSAGVDKRTMVSRDEVRAQKTKQNPVNLNYQKNIHRIYTRLTLIRTDLGRLSQRIRAEQNIEGTKAVKRLLDTLSSFEDALGMFQRATTKDYAEKVLSVARGALAEAQLAKDELDIACGREPEGKRKA